MAIMFRTPDILSDITKQSHYDEQGNYSKEIREVLTTEVKLLKILNRMVKEGVPLSQTKLKNRAGVTPGTVNHYDYIFKDVIDMYCLFYPAAPKRKTQNPKFQEAEMLMNKYNIHDFDALEKGAIKNMILNIALKNDKLAILADDLYDKGIVNETFNEKAPMPSEAIFSFMAQRYIHPDFESLDINGMRKKVYEKYQKVQELKAEYNRLKADSSNS